MENTATTLPSEKAGPFLRPLDWGAFWTAFLISFTVYFYTLAPTLTLEDSGELATAGAFLGVPHPPGYPIWTMIVWVFTKVFAFVTYRGQPNPAWAIGLASGFFGALATGTTALLICRSGSDMFRDLSTNAVPLTERTRKLFCWTAGVSSSLIFAFTSINWSQSVIVEAYSLNAFFLVLVMALAYWWFCRPSTWGLFVLCLMFGLGITNYQAILLMFPALVVLIVVKDLSLARDFMIGALLFGIVLILIFYTDYLPVIASPLHVTGIVYTVLNFAALILIYFFLPHGRIVALAILGFELGLAVYGYMPISSETNPPMNWAYPRTWEGFLHAVRRGQYEKISPTPIFSMDFVHQLGDYLADLRAQFTLPIAILGLLPFAVWRIRVGRHSVIMAYVAVALTAAAVLLILIEELIVPSGIPVMTYTYKSLIVLIMLALAIGSVTFVVNEGEELIAKVFGRIRATVSERITAAAVVLGVAFLYFVWVYMLSRKIVEVAAPLRQHPSDPHQIKIALLQSAILLLLILLPAMLTLGISFVRQKVTHLELIMDRASQKWVIVTLASFVVMGVVFVDLASPKGDLQDYFIQRVKFISSHALYSIWVGYGMIVGFAYALIVVDKFFKNRRWINLLVSGTGVAFVLLLPLVPLGENAFNKEQIRRVGGAEENGHDFGWQFGNYQLRGAEAITEELDPEEEPLPNPSFPPEMGQNAIFFGGTDPGRFVPTYMIYSARVREDVYLITQNALADNTYMGVMRDLYGDQIWIPSQPESAMAFQRYVEEVHAGKRPQNADLKIEGGRVQVSGALGVMEINGILCQMIFEHNNYKHPFYIEESYVIRWMYPYLTPHGLIMKLNAQPLDLTDEIVRNDMDFWDWYTRRLSSNNKFIRDIVARKSFSKLRTAIGGLYAARGRFREAEEAYQEGRILYSLSPEANFRLAQEVYLSHGRAADAKAVIRQFSSEDPGNTQAKAFLSQIDSFEKMTSRIGELEGLIPQGKLSVDAALELGDLYLQGGQGPKFMALAGSIMANSNLPSLYTFRIAALYHRAGRFEEMSQALDQFVNRIPPDMPPEAFVDITRMYLAGQKMDKARNVLQEYLKRRPGDWRAWMDQASLELGLGRTNEAVRALEVSVRGGGNEAIDFINRNPNYAPIREEAIRRAQTLINVPGVKPLTPW